MPLIPVNVANIRLGASNGYVYSFDPISDLESNVNGLPVRVCFVTQITISTPEGYTLENVRDANPDGDQGDGRMVFDPVETSRVTSGRVYIRAARLIDRMRADGVFVQVPNP